MKSLNFASFAALSLASTLTSLALINTTANPALALPDCVNNPDSPICNPRPDCANNPDAEICNSRPPAPVYGTVRVPGFALAYVATQVSPLIQDTKLYLNNHNGNSSYIKLPAILGGTQQGFTLPPKVVDLDCGWLCPDLGDAYFYVNDWGSTQTQLRWQSPYFVMSISMESAGREIKGYHSGYVSLGDDAIPDAHIDNAKIDVMIQPTLVNGKISYRIASSTMTGNIQATSVCNVFGIDVCDFFLGYKDMVRSTIEQQVQTRLSNPLLRQRLDAIVQPKLAQMGVPQFGNITTDQVRAEGGDLLFVYRK
jgi:hypothetical protein